MVYLLMAKKIEKLGDIMHELEAVIGKMIDQHDLQRHEVLGLVDNYIKFHYPNATEEFEDGTKPFTFFGHIDGAKRAIKNHR